MWRQNGAAGTRRSAGQRAISQRRLSPAAGLWDALCCEGKTGQRAETISVEGSEHALQLVLGGSVARGLGPSPTAEAMLRDRRGPELGGSWHRGRAAG